MSLMAKYLSTMDTEAGHKAQQIIENLTAEVEPGRVYLGKVTRTERYGAFVEILPGKEGLVHISHLERFRVNKTEDVVNVGDQVQVKVLDIDDRGRKNLSRREALPRTSKSDEKVASIRKRRSIGIN